MAEILSLKGVEVPCLTNKHFQFSSFVQLISHLFKKSNKETDSNIPIVILLPHNPPSTTNSELEKLSFSEKTLLLTYFFNHLNLVILDESFDKDETDATIAKASRLLKNRISRVGNWTGTTHFNCEAGDCLYDSQSKIAGVIPTMSYVLNVNASRSAQTTDQLIHFKDLLLKEINFFDLLDNSSPKRLSELCFAVGHWSFPAHELSNDDLVYCVYLMIAYAIQHVKVADQKDDSLHLLSANELLGFVFTVRDTYRNGNPFHNFRHAVDVLQACFHFVIRLGSLPRFQQFISDPESEYKPQHNETTELIALKESPKENISHLNPIQTLGLLIAALGHDVGHPGTTNDFMIKFNAPTALLFNDRSVLESYHSSVFINKVLAVCWPSLLSAKIDDKTELTVRSLIISSILATDMGEHNEYVNRLKSFKTNNEILNHDNTVKLISALLIKCADISNVTRPLRVSSQWAMVLSREFAEVETLKNLINHEDDASSIIDLTKDLTYDHVPDNLQEILTLQPNLQNGQIFFINLFAENLFNNIAELLPQLQYTCDIILHNKNFWLERAKS
ncbi:MAG: 3',5'-cyclic nucleotide phosphodiesterase [Asgard group archaeon]|nr:3',5'-cyclic nucleotide phosphodiesterase [Asgard group archaeon]